ncbi:MAG: hypothetical protein ABSF77_09465 [Spirochaetia bacterium]|jgi:hypothetical protein
MPDFNIHALDSLEPGHDKADKAFDRYRRSLVDTFCSSPEGQTHAAKHGSTGFWAGCLLDFGFNHIGVTLPNMTMSNLKEIVTDYFPRKVSLRSSEEAEDIIPELIAFWRFLGREFRLDAAEAALRYLGEIEPSFMRIMNDPSRFGMAKSFFMQGQAAGFDMTDQDQMNLFIAAYNARVAAEPGGSPATPPSRSEFPDEDPRVRRNRTRSLRRKIAGISKRHPGKKRR